MRGQRFALRMNPARADSKEIASQLAAVAGAGLHEFLRCRAASGGGFGPAPGCDRLPGGGQGAGACQPLAPYNPLPRLRQPSLTGNFSPQAVPFSPLPVARHRASPSRCPARGTSVRAAAELPPLQGGDLHRAMQRLRHQTGWPEALGAKKRHAE